MAGIAGSRMKGGSIKANIQQMPQSNLLLYMGIQTNAQNLLSVDSRRWRTWRRYSERRTKEAECGLHMIRGIYDA